ncbi:MAG: hypothetical protein B6I35_03320, partial [Anaerolineaceae bacterium 4572_32.2]
MPAIGHDPQFLRLAGPCQLLLRTGFCRFPFPIDKQQRPGADAAYHRDRADLVGVNASLTLEEEKDEPVGEGLLPGWVASLVG